MRTIILILFLTLPAFPQMLQGIVGGKAPAGGDPAAILQHKMSTAQASTLTVAFDSTVSATSTIIVACAIGGYSNSTWGISDSNGNSYSATTAYRTTGAGSAALKMWWFYHPALTTNPPTITVTNSSAGSMRCNIREYSGLSGVADGSASVAGDSTAINPQVTDSFTTTAKDVLVQMFFDGVASTDAAGSGWGNEDAVTGAYNYMCADQLNVSAGTYYGSQIPSSTGTNWLGMVAAFKVQ